MAVKLFKPKAGSIAAFNKDGIAIKDIKNIEGTDAILVTYKDNSQKIFENYNYFINHIGYKEAYNPKTFESVNTLIESTDINVGDIIYYNNEFIIVNEELKNKLEALTVSSIDGVLDPFNDGSCIFYAPLKGSYIDLISGDNIIKRGPGGQLTQDYFDGDNGKYMLLPKKVIPFDKSKGLTLSYQIDYNKKNYSNNGGWNEYMTHFTNGSTVESANDQHNGFIIGSKEFGGYCKINQNSFGWSISKTNGFITLVVVIDKSQSRLYVDGTLKGSNNVTINDMYSNIGTILGCFNQPDDSLFGKIKNIRFFNKALTNEEIQTLAKGQGTVKKSVKKLAL